MATVLRPVGHEDKLSLVEHLDELRTRILVCVAAVTVCFGVAFWQNQAILDFVNEPLKEATRNNPGDGPLERNAAFQQLLGASARSQRALADALAADQGVSAPTRQAARDAAAAAERVARNIPKASPQNPVTLGVGEPFFQTVRVAAYAALLVTLPLLLWQLYAFVLPAFSPRERSVALPMMSLVPGLFYAGAAFAYFVVLPNALQFLVGFNDENFEILLQARDFYRFTLLVMMAMGALFQIPVAILLLTRAGIVSVEQLRANRRYAILVIAVLAMFLPGTDPITMLLAMAPLVVLYEGSILLAALLARRAARAEVADGDDDRPLPAIHDSDDD